MIDTIINILIRARNRFSKTERVYYPPGHFYSPIPSQTDLARTTESDSILGIDLKEENQLTLLGSFRHIYSSLEIPETKSTEYHYYFDNNYFSYSDGIILSCILSHFKSKKIIEIGSGFSTALIIDVSQKHLDSSIDITCIEPYEPERLNTLLTDKTSLHWIKKPIQDVDLNLFNILQKDDILFIDSSHVLKKGSDLQFIFNQILPRLNKGVIIHFHDIFYPFEYPRKWLNEGVYFNEAYALRNFLMFNDSFELVYFSDMMEKKHREWFEQNMPLCLKEHESMNQRFPSIKSPEILGQSIYIRKTS